MTVIATTYNDIDDESYDVRPLTPHRAFAVRPLPSPSAPLAIHVHPTFTLVHLGGPQVSEQARIVRLRARPSRERQVGGWLDRFQSEYDCG